MRTKIIVTTGPHTDPPQVLETIIREGADIIRMNFSHYKHEKYRKDVARVRAAAKKFKKNVKILQDLQGPRIRVGALPAQGIKLEENKVYIFSHAGAKAKGTIPISDPYLHADIKAGDPFYLANGDLELEVQKTSAGKIYAKVLRGGTLYSNKAINVPLTNVRTGGLTSKDRADLRFALKTGVDMIALSFVQSPDDVVKLRKLLGKNKKIQIVAKIERAIALRRIDEIIQVSDAIMVARGDLGIETPVQDLPIIQKNLIRHAHWHNTPAIIATQMLTSMITHHNPTRAEVSDVANAIFDGADAVMLSDETAMGADPVRTVATLRKVVERAENYMHAESLLTLK